MSLHKVATLAGSALVAMTILAPHAAHAGANSPTSTTDGAAAQFLHSGDILNVCDTAPDGESVYGQYKINGGSTKTTSQWNGGNNTCGSKSTGDPSEGSEVQIRAAHQDELSPDDYGAWKTGIA